MTSEQYEIFDTLRKDFKAYCSKLNAKYKNILFPLQKAAASKDTPDYPLETAIVYNTALDEITIDSEIKLIVIGDNPGKDEQLAVNQKYLVGQAGKLGNKFFAEHKELQTDFRKNVIILNKTPVHSAKTNHLKTMINQGGTEVLNLLQETQIFMADLICRLQKLFSCQIWMVGYGELKNGGLFDTFKKQISINCQSDTSSWIKILVFQHFSMNRFTIDLRAFMQNHPELSLKDSLEQLGSNHKSVYFS